MVIAIVICDIYFNKKFNLKPYILKNLYLYDSKDIFILINIENYILYLHIIVIMRFL